MYRAFVPELFLLVAGSAQARAVAPNLARASVVAWHPAFEVAVDETQEVGEVLADLGC